MHSRQEATSFRVSLESEMSLTLYLTSEMSSPTPHQRDEFPDEACDTGALTQLGGPRRLAVGRLQVQAAVYRPARSTVRRGVCHTAGFDGKLTRSALNKSS